jgi:hypothetical protein
MGDSNLHNHKRCPLIVLGHANGQLKGNNHVRVPVDTPMANTMLALLHMLGVQKDKFSDSTEAMELNTVAPTTTAANNHQGM